VTGRPVVWMPGGVRTEVHLTGADTGGAFCLLLDEPPPGWSLPPHLHRHESETIHVTAGRFEMTVDGASVRMEAGDTVHVPAGVVHSGGTAGDSGGRRIIVFSPAGLEQFFLEAGTPAPESDVDLDSLLAMATQHGWEFVR
jgi:quercetin dioxygenase-like cupin family protein